MGGQAQDGQEPSQPSAERNRHKKSAQATCGVELQAAQTLRLLWNYRERPGAGRSFIEVSWRWRK